MDNNQLLELFDQYVASRKLDIAHEQRILQLEDELRKLKEVMEDGGHAHEYGKELRGAMIRRNMRMLMCGPDAVILTKSGIDVVEGVFTIHRKEGVEG